MLKQLSLSACALLMCSLLTTHAAEATPLKVCAVPQMHNALTLLERTSPVTFESFIATPDELYSRIANSSEKICDVLLTADERLPDTLIRSGKVDGSTLQSFAKAPLILWSPNPRMFRNNNAPELFKNKTIKTIAIAQESLTPVGYATSQVLKSNKLTSSYLRDYTFKSDHEYQVHAMVADGNVECGFITLPLVSSITRQANGSWWEVPASWYDPIEYHSALFTDSKDNADAQKFVQSLTSDQKTRDTLDVLGFKAL